MPEDACLFVKAESERWDGDGHTHSWLTLKEIKEYQEKNIAIVHSGLISPNQQRDLDDNGILPESWCQGTNLMGYERREWSHKNESLVPLIEKVQSRAKELLQYDFEEYNTENDENIRIVFWFDN